MDYYKKIILYELKTNYFKIEIINNNVKTKNNKKKLNFNLFICIY